MAKSVVLIGFPGCGKTAVGRALSENYGWSWVDVDEWVVVEVGRSIAELIRVDGEQNFRKIESKGIARAIESGVDVISVGGGALAQQVNRELLAKASNMVQLRIGPEEAAKRVFDDEQKALSEEGDVKRPLLAIDENGAPFKGDTVEAMQQRVEVLMRERATIYQMASLVLDAETLSAEELAAVIVERFPRET
jgi:shikimate kinase